VVEKDDIYNQALKVSAPRNMSCGGMEKLLRQVDKAGQEDKAGLLCLFRR
jgi:hypothetical protein